MTHTINLYLLRHGKPEGKPALNGFTDVTVPLATQQAISQALADKNLGFQHIITSPLSRCSELAEVMVKSNSALSLTLETEFREMNFGRLDGVPFDNIAEDWQKLEAFWQDPAKHTLPGAESLDDFHERVSTCFEQYAEKVNQDTLIICHGGTIRMILAFLLKLDWRNPALYSVLTIGYQSLTHIKITHADKRYSQVCSISQPL
ncbi:alpha-ribazole phosphatase [Veronia nyctiphanis]|uniref:Alpha-ribazole phosphatase n=1 Tax=Veronia nyctiphanis TaxID=1278244 RepID=A0A4Q0YJH0_9GAMM|nr:histidine phosphatase family protein [Veronia nyctiphanis]RXJ69974.1 alpha-ribazole phosphatase [Veronia nyctiphanis]